MSGQGLKGTSSRGKVASLLWRYLRPLRVSMAIATIFALLLGAVSAAVGLLLGPTLRIMTTPRTEELPLAELVSEPLRSWIATWFGRVAWQAGELLDALPWALLGLAAVRAGLGLVQWFLWERAGERASLAVRNDIVSAYLGFDPNKRRHAASREMEEQLSSAVSTDVRVMREFIVHNYGGLPRELVQVLAYAVTLVLISPKLFLLFALGIAPAIAVFSRVGRKLRKRAAAVLADSSTMTEWLQQRLLGIETIKHYGTEALESTKMRELSASLHTRFLQAARVKARTSPLLEAVATVALTLVLVIALHDVMAGATTGAMLFSFFTVLALLSQSAGKLGRYLNSNREGAAAVERLQTLLTYLNAQQTLDLGAVEHTKGDHIKLTCRDLTVIYPDATRAALADFSFTFEGGRAYCLVGPSGAGKSTVLNTLLGLVKPKQGQIALAAPKSDVKPWVLYMPQKVQLVPDTVSANVAYPDAEPDLARVEAALARVDLTEAVRALPQGVATIVGEGGVGVSGGQAQRMLLARLWYHSAPIVLVDEGTSALDPEVEQLVHTLLRDLATRGAAVVTIAHRKAMALAADVVLLLDDGRLVTSGTPTTVLQSAAFKSILR